MEKEYWDVIDKTNLVCKEVCQGTNDYKTGGIFYGLFLAPKIKYCLTIKEFGIFQENKTFKGFNDSRRLLDCPQPFKMIDGKKLSAMLPISWEKLFTSGVIIPTKMRFCNDCNDIRICDKCNNQINGNKEFKTNSKLLKRQAPNQFGQMLH